MISKVKSVVPNGTYQSPNGLLYKFNYEMEDGAKLVANHKTEQSPFGIGDEVDYHIKGSNSYGSWGSVKKPESNFSPQVTTVAPSAGKQYGKSPEEQDQIMRQSSLNRAVEVLGQNKEPMQYTGLAEYFFNYVKTGVVEPEPKAEPKPKASVKKGKEDDDDLPF